MKVYRILFPYLERIRPTYHELLKELNSSVDGWVRKSERYKLMVEFAIFRLAIDGTEP